MKKIYFYDLSEVNYFRFKKSKDTLFRVKV